MSSRVLGRVHAGRSNFGVKVERVMTLGPVADED